MNIIITVILICSRCSRIGTRTAHLLVRGIQYIRTYYIPTNYTYEYILRSAEYFEIGRSKVDSYFVGNAHEEALRMFLLLLICSAKE